MSGPKTQLSEQMYFDLVVCVADAPSHEDRASAMRLLIREFAARWRDSDRNLENGVSFESLFSGWLGGPNKAAFFFYWAQGDGIPPEIGGVMVGSTPRVPDSGYAAELAAVTAEAAPLIAEVKTDTGISAFSARRRRLQGSAAAPSAPFLLEPIHEHLTSSDFEFAAGTYTVQFAGHVWSRDTANPAAVSVSIAVNGVIVETHELTRSADPGTPEPELRSVSVSFNTEDEVVLAAPGVITLVNAGAFEQNARGVLRVFET